MGKTIRVLRATPGLACGSEDPPEHTRQGGRFLRLCRSPKPATQRFFGQLELLLAMGFITCIDICFVYMYADTHACTVHVYLYMYVYIYIYIYISLSLSLCVFMCLNYHSGLYVAARCLASSHEGLQPVKDTRSCSGRAGVNLSGTPA